MVKALQVIHPLILMLMATTLEVCGDAIVRMAIFNHVGLIRLALFLIGALIMVYNLWMTVRHGEATSASPHTALQPAE